jgi:hypothetical protein
MAKTKTPASAPTAATNGGAGKPGPRMTKKDGVRQAITNLGWDAKPKAIQKYLKDDLGIDMTTDQISTTKWVLAQKAGKGKAKGPANGKPALVASAAARETAPNPPAAGAIPPKDVLAVKELVGRLRAGPLHTLIDAFAG